MTAFVIRRSHCSDNIPLEPVCTGSYAVHVYITEHDGNLRIDCQHFSGCVPSLSCVVFSTINCNIKKHSKTGRCSLAHLMYSFIYSTSTPGMCMDTIESAEDFSYIPVVRGNYLPWDSGLFFHDPSTFGSTLHMFLKRSIHRKARQHHRNRDSCTIKQKTNWGKKRTKTGNSILRNLVRQGLGIESQMVCFLESYTVGFILPACS